ncbi:MAG: multifunctional CCA addition/repair protein [Magnetococcales bacterium]|nr:multifunctional CCA addition/repair protein [Magnetococcales bacterium]
MTRYRVGGWVRDSLLGLPPGDRDWVVVGASPAELLARGFRPVGAEFPVFLHPTTGEHHALARTERKCAPGHRGFVSCSTPAVTLEEDLARRDLTINAMALDERGMLVDPWGGRADLAARRLRHVAPAFAEDPLRVLRVARFAARLAPLGFRVAEDTLALMTRLTASGELAALTPERVWMETVKALESPRPPRYFQLLRRCGALAVLFPELAALVGVPQPLEHHPEGDVWTHALLALERAGAITPDPRIRFAALVHDLGKGCTPPDLWPRHLGHDRAGLLPLEQLCHRLAVPNDYRRLAALAVSQHMRCHRALEMRPGKVVRLLTDGQAWRHPELFEGLLLVSRADRLGTGRPTDCAGPDPEPFLRQAWQVGREVRAAPFLAQGLSGPAVGAALLQERIRRVARISRTREQCRLPDPSASILGEASPSIELNPECP